MGNEALKMVESIVNYWDQACSVDTADLEDPLDLQLQAVHSSEKVELPERCFCVGSFLFPS